MVYGVGVLRRNNMTLNKVIEILLEIKNGLNKKGLQPKDEIMEVSLVYLQDIVLTIKDKKLQKAD